MSYSLEIRNGDLGLNGTSLGTVAGAHKLTQDLAVEILTPKGLDSAHPEFGSLLDGGLLPSGQIVEGIIGETDWNHIALVVQAEMTKIAHDYQNQQISRNQADASVYGKSTLTPDETLVSLEKVEMVQAQDNLLVLLTLKTGNGPIQLNIPVASGTVITT